MNIKTDELKRALNFFESNGNTPEIEITIDSNLQSRIILTGDAKGDRVIITLYESSLGIFPKKTITERL